MPKDNGSGSTRKANKYFYGDLQFYMNKIKEYQHRYYRWKDTKRAEVERIRQFSLISIGYYKKSKYTTITLVFKEKILRKLLDGIDEGLIEYGDQCPLSFEKITDLIAYRLSIERKLIVIRKRRENILNKISETEKIVDRCDWILKWGIKWRAKQWKHEKVVSIRKLFNRIEKHIELVGK